MSMPKLLPWILGAALGGAVALVVPRLLQKPTPAEHGADAGKPERKIVRYRGPMNPLETSPVPRKDSMGMDFLPVYSDEEQPPSEVTGLARVKIDGQRQQLIGLRTAEVTQGPIASDWRTVGRVAVDETRVRKINVKVDGFVEKLFVDYTGKQVRRGDPLFSIYSPDLLSAEQEYLLALTTRHELAESPAGEELVASARRRLELWDIPKSELDALERTQTLQRTLTLTSPVSGVVTAKNVVQGARLQAGEMPFEITDLSEVWVLADAFESDLPHVRIGTPASLTLDAIPNHPFAGKVIFIEPVLDAKTRTAKVRLAFANPHGDLRPEMFGQVVFHARPHDGIRVPADSIIDAGDRKVVFVTSGDGQFEPRDVTTGATAGDLVEILSGVRPGEQVVVRANFLLDSESQLKAAIAAPVAKAPGEGSAP
jgi:Cu(I)/Ag(I) efflux system membrane fusion protein